MKSSKSPLSIKLAISFIAKFLFIGLLLAQPVYAEKPDIFLLKTYDGSQDIRGWIMSEKLDGVRGIWDGEQLRSRNGKVLNAPRWFTRKLPPFALDGELWTTRRDFENIVSIVRTKNPAADRWLRIRYYIFDVPNQPGGFQSRMTVLYDYLQEHPNPHLKILPQSKVETPAQLKRFLTEVSALGGEGVVVRNPNVPYQTGRLSSALKVKNHIDAECLVKKIVPGNGKYADKMGSLQCDAGSLGVIKIGSGFSDHERAHPPPQGSIITFKYYGLTGKGKPRFPIYLRAKQ